MARRGSSDEASKVQKTAEMVIARIQWDTDLNPADFSVGYEDRFLGELEKRFSKIEWDVIAQHRLLYFKYKGLIIWDKRGEKADRVDDVFGSLGSGRTIADVLEDFSSGRLKEVPNPVLARTAELLAAADKKPGRWVKPSATAVASQTVDGATHFVAIRIPKGPLRDALAGAQGTMASLSLPLGECLINPATFHVCLLSLCLKTEEAVEAATALMSSAGPWVCATLPPATTLACAGVYVGDDGIAVHARVADPSLLSPVFAELQSRFAAAGLTVVESRGFSPRVTLAKLFGRNLRETGTIDPAAIKPFEHVHFGELSVKGLHFCSCVAPKEADGFFARLVSVSNHVVADAPEAPVTLSAPALIPEGHAGDDSGPVAVGGAGGPEAGHDTLHAHAAHTHAITDAKRAQDAAVVPALVHTLVASGDPLVVIMRGTPGSGKSYVAALLHKTAVAAGVPSVLCSTDDFFMRGGHYEFSKAKLSAAHEHTYQTFTHAVTSGVKIVIVDNTNSRLWEYAKYDEFGVAHGYTTKILEINCPNVDILKRFQSRNSHSVDWATVFRMYGRWELDPRATLLPPFGCDDIPLTSSLALQYIGVFLDEPSQAAIKTAFGTLFPYVTCEHITCAYRPEMDLVLATVPQLGTWYTFNIVGASANDRIQAVAVEVLDTPETPKAGFFCVNNTPHVTISLIPQASAAESNELLASYEPLGAPHITIRGRLSFLFKMEKGITRCVSDATLARALLAVQPPPHTGPAAAKIRKVGAPATVGATPPKPRKAAAVVTTANTGALPPVPGRLRLQEGPPTTLLVFDFDDTLFTPPDEDGGKKALQTLTGEAWSKVGWYWHPESLDPRLDIAHAECLPVFRALSGCAGTVTALVSGRGEETRDAVLRVLAEESLRFDRAYFRPSSAGSTAMFKVNAVRRLLVEYPSIKCVKMWDDKSENLEAVAAAVDVASMELVRVSPKDPLHCPPALASALPSSALLTFTQQRGLFPLPALSGAMKAATSLLSQCWKSVVLPTPTPEAAVPLPGYFFGAWPVGAPTLSPQLCLCLPDTLTRAAVVPAFAAALTARGVVCALLDAPDGDLRLAARLQFESCPTVEYDIRFSSVPLAALIGRLPSPAEFLAAGVDALSAAALAGPASTHALLEATGPDESPVRVGAVGPLLQYMLSLLAAARLDQDMCVCPQASHVLTLITPFLLANTRTLSPAGVDALLPLALTHLASLPPSAWGAVVEPTVPPEHFGPVCALFATAADRLSAAPLTPLTLRRTLAEIRVESAFPVEAPLIASVSLRAKGGMQVWWAAELTARRRIRAAVCECVRAGAPVRAGTAVWEGTAGVTLSFHTRRTKAAAGVLGVALAALVEELSQSLPKDCAVTWKTE